MFNSVIVHFTEWRLRRLRAEMRALLERRDMLFGIDGVATAFLHEKIIECRDKIERITGQEEAIQ